MGCQGFFEILMITLISRKIRGGYRLMKHTVGAVYLKVICFFFCRLACLHSKMIRIFFFFIFHFQTSDQSERINLFVTSKTKPRIHQFKVLPESRLKPLFNVVLFLIRYFHYFKKHFKPCFFFILKAFKDILQHFKFVNW